MREKRRSDNVSMGTVLFFFGAKTGKCISVNHVISPRLSCLAYYTIWWDLFQPDNRISLVMDRTRLIIVKPGSKSFL